MLKVKSWDKDQNGSFDPCEVEAAVAELKKTERAMADMKWRMIFLFIFILFFTGIVLGACGIAFAVIKDTSVPKDSATLRAPAPSSSAKPGKTELVVTTETRSDDDLISMLKYDSNTDQWLMTDKDLREIDSITFWSMNNTFYHLDVAEIMRYDGNKSLQQEDKLEITTAAGTMLRVMEDTCPPCSLEVLWPGKTKWEGVSRNSTKSGGRLLSQVAPDGELPEFMEGEELLGEDDVTEVDGVVMTNQPHERRLGKGGFVVVGYYGGGAGGYGRGGGGGCNGRCNVPWNAGETSCSAYCQIGACYSWSNGNTYRCDGAASIFGTSTWLLQAAVAMLFITRAAQDTP